MASQIGDEPLNCSGIPRRIRGRVFPGPEAINPALIGELVILIVGSVLAAPAGDPDCSIGPHLDIDRIEGPALAQGHAAPTPGVGQNLKL